MDSKCSPIESDNNYSCIDSDIIKEIGNIFNNEFKLNINLKKNTKSIYNDIIKHLKHLNKDCTSEVCLKYMNIIKNNLSKDKLKRFINSFKPDMPNEWINNYNMWLNTKDLNEVMEQYEKSDNRFRFYGPTPIDFKLKDNNGDCKVDELCKFDLKDNLNNNKTKIGIIFNTDPHHKSGEHWISMYIDCKNNNMDIPCIYFFDSTGEEAPSEIMELVDEIKNQGINNNITFTYLWNNKEHQKGTTECGVYSLNFLISMINNENFVNYTNNIKNDKYMEKYRKKYYNI